MRGFWKTVNHQENALIFSCVDSMKLNIETQIFFEFTIMSFNCFLPWIIFRKMAQTLRYNNGQRRHIMKV